MLINKLFFIPLHSLIWEPILFTNTEFHLFFDSMQVRSCSMLSFLAYFTHGLQFQLFWLKWWDSILIYGWMLFCYMNMPQFLFTNQFKDTLVISISWWLWKVLKWTWEVRCAFHTKFYLPDYIIVLFLSTYHLGTLHTVYHCFSSLCVLFSNSLCLFS